LHDHKKKSIEVAIQEALQKNGIELHDKSLINQAVLLLFKEECTLPRYASSSKEMVDAETQLKD
jgi:outer membrane lipopolysaccharide assembly protein LptE/RlpB